MMFGNQLDLAFLNGLFVNFLQVLFVIAGILYVIFSVIIVRQIYTMQQSLVTSFSGRLRFLSYVHLGLAFGALLFFLWSF